MSRQLQSFYKNTISQHEQRIINRFSTKSSITDLYQNICGAGCSVKTSKTKKHQDGQCGSQKTLYSTFETAQSVIQQKHLEKVGRFTGVFVNVSFGKIVAKLTNSTVNLTNQLIPR